MARTCSSHDSPRMPANSSYICLVSSVGLPGFTKVSRKRILLSLKISPSLVNAALTASGVVETVKAAFTKEGDIFKESKILFLDTFVNPGKPTLLTKQMYDEFAGILGLSWEEHVRAINEGLKAQDKFMNGVLRAQGR